MTIEASITDDVATCHAIRAEVFVVEQGISLEEDIDGLDEEATHFLLHVDGSAVGTARVLVSDGVGKVGRVAILKSHRGQGLGNVIMGAISDHARDAGLKKLVLGSQTTATGFYEGLGYVAEGDEFMDAGIQHMKMVLEL